jgi:CRISPR-associated protein Csm1
LNIRDDFAKYTANHPDLHISAGLAFIGGKYPIYQAADDAEVILKSAKKNDGKNSFGFIGNAWTWVEFLEVRDKFERIVEIVSDKNGPHAIIQTLRELAEMKLERQKGDKEIWGPWQWRGAYLLKRMEERAKDELAREIKSIRESLDKNGYADIKQWGAAARWAQLQTRTKKESTKKGE